jgi:hypothetical protein
VGIIDIAAIAQDQKRLGAYMSQLERKEHQKESAPVTGAKPRL